MICNPEIRNSKSERSPKLEDRKPERLPTGMDRRCSRLEFRVYAATAVCVIKPPEGGTPNCGDAPTRTARTGERYIRVPESGIVL